MSTSDYLPANLHRASDGLYLLSGNKSKPAAGIEKVSFELLSTLLPADTRAVAICGCYDHASLQQLATQLSELLIIEPCVTTAQRLLQQAAWPGNVHIVAGNSPDIPWREKPDIFLLFSATPGQQSQFPSEKSRAFVLPRKNKSAFAAIRTDFAEQPAGSNLLSELSGTRDSGKLPVLLCEPHTVYPDLQAVFVALDRIPPARTVTRVSGASCDSLRVEKTLASGASCFRKGPVSLHPCSSEWQQGHSLHSEIISDIRAGTAASVQELFSPCAIWLQKLESLGERIDNEVYVPGNLLDALWMNTYCRDGECSFIDLEWHWGKKIPLRVLLIRAVYVFLIRAEEARVSSALLASSSYRSLITQVAESLDYCLTREDFESFIHIESHLQAATFGGSARRYAFSIRLRLFNSHLYRVLRTLSHAARCTASP